MLLHTFQSTYSTGYVLDSLSSMLKGLALSCHTCQSTVFPPGLCFSDPVPVDHLARPL